MNYTPNFHLPQWDKDDRIMMDDFNQFAANLESALTQNQEATEAVAEQAQDTADQLSTVAQERPRIKTGGYLGRGGTIAVNMNCMPQVIFISGKPSQRPLPESAYPTHKYSGILLLEGPTVSGKVTTTGIEVTEINQAECPNLNAPNYWYNYVVLF